jgi:hypothetical protein
MAKTVAEIFIETLVNVGVKRVYGVVGDSLNGLTEIIRKSKQIEWLHVRHEEVAAFAAGAEAHLTGEIAVCAGSCGPGNQLAPKSDPYSSPHFLRFRASSSNIKTLLAILLKFHCDQLTQKPLCWKPGWICF